MRKSYSARAAEYIAALGSTDDMDPVDISLITEWGRNISGPILDAGSGPGHWTDFLRRLGCDVRGLDMVPDFIASARQRFPHSTFDSGNFLDMPFESSRFNGILAWYSLIHMQPDTRELALHELARVLKPTGTLLIGGFLGPQDTPFNHAITEAFYWSEKGLTRDLESTGFHVISTHTRFPKGSRPHISAVARRC